MKAVFQRVTRATVRIEGQEIGRIGRGAVVLLGVAQRDTETEARWMARKVIELRVFPDEDGKMNRGLLEVGGEILVVSQFTLFGDCRKGRRPSYIRAGRPEIAEPLYETFVAACRQLGAQVVTGKFQAMMEVEIHNDGPVTLLLERERDGQRS